MLLKRLTISTLTVLCVTVSGRAQDSLSTVKQSAAPSPLLRNYTFVRQQDAWLSSGNAAGLTRFQAANIAQADLSASYAEGALTDFGGATNVVEAGASVEALYRITPRTVVYGAISYQNWTGRHMAGSAFMSQRTPFDIVEQTNDNTGRKHRDTYHLTGGAGIDLWRGYSVGLKLDYTAANYAKYKDLRHQNKLMDLTVTAGLLAPIADWLSAGVHYQYHRTTESVAFGTYGKNDARTYKSLIAYGAFMGRSEQFGSTGYTDNSREMPLVEDQNGGALQLELRPFRHGADWLQPITLFAEASLHHGTGYYGRKSAYTATYTNHHRDITQLHAQLAYATTSGKTRHTLDVTYQDEQLKNNVENFRELTNASGAYYYHYYDPTEAARKHWYDLRADYTLHLGIQGEQPTWTLRAGYHRQERKQTAYLYPFYRYQRLTTHELTAAAERNILTRHGRWTAALNAAYQKGSGTPYTDGIFVMPSSKQALPATQDTYLMQDYHLLTSPQYTLGAAAQYTFVPAVLKLPVYVRTAFQYSHANSRPADCCGTERTTTTLALGCTF